MAKLVQVGWGSPQNSHALAQVMLMPVLMPKCYRKSSIPRYHLTSTILDPSIQLSWIYPVCSYYSGVSIQTWSLLRLQVAQLQEQLSMQATQMDALHRSLAEAQSRPAAPAVTPAAPAPAPACGGPDAAALLEGMAEMRSALMKKDGEVRASVAQWTYYRNPPYWIVCKYVDAYLACDTWPAHASVTGASMLLCAGVWSWAPLCSWCKLCLYHLRCLLTMHVCE